MPGKVKTSWKPGQSGNPHGRPKNPLNKAIQKALEEKHWIVVDGKRRLMTEKEILISVLRQHGRAGNLKAIEMLFDRGWGKPVQAVEMSGELDTGARDGFVSLKQMQAALKAEVDRGVTAKTGGNGKSAGNGKNGGNGKH